MKYIMTGQTRSDAKRQWQVMVDDEDYEYLNQFHWQVDKNNCVSGNRSKKGKRTLIHRFILNAPENMEVDHIDGNRLNNQKSNLRLATSSQNKCNRGPRKDNKSGYKGVIWNTQRNIFQAHIMTPQGLKFLGSFKDKNEAALAYNHAALKYQGEFAYQNQI